MNLFFSTKLHIFEVKYKFDFSNSQSILYIKYIEFDINILNKHMKIQFLTLFLLSSFVFNRTTLNLNVTNNYGHPLENVYIKSIINNVEFEVIGKTDQMGVFVFNVENSDINSISFSHIGYDDKIVTIESLFENENIVLDFNNIKSNQVVVTGTRSETHIKDTPILTYVISSDQIEKSAYSSVKEALEMTLPNIQNVISSHAGISNEQVKIQGLDNKYLLFLIDGKRVSGEFAGNLDFKMLDLSNVDRIEIIEGGMSSLYGSSAIGGVVNIITKKQSKPFQIKYSYLQDDPMINVHSFNMGLGYRDFSYNFNIVNQKTDGYDLTPSSDLNEEFILKTLEEYNTLSLNHIIGYDNKKNFSVRMNYKHYKNDIFLYSNHRIPILDQEDPFYYYTSYRTWIPKFEDFNYGLNLNYYKNNSLLNVVYNSEEYIKSNYFFNYTEESCNSIDCSNSNNVTGADFVNARDKKNSLLIQYNLDRNNNLFTLGIEYNDDSYSSYNIYRYTGDEDNDGQCTGGPFSDCLVESIFDSIDDTKYYKKKSFFIGNQWNFLGNKIGASYRYVDSNNFDDNYVYSLSYMIKQYQPYDFRLNYSRGFRIPSIKELYYNWYGHNPAIVGNQNLLPTTNDYISISIQKFEKNQDFSIELFYNDVKDMIGGIYVDVNDDGTDEYQYSNFNSILFYGINSHINKKIGNNTFKLVYNFTNPESNSNSASQLISKNSFRFKWVASFIENKFDVSLNVKFSGKKFMMLGSNKINLDSYFIYDLIAIYNLNKNINLKVGWKNLHNYRDNRRLLENGSDYLTVYDPGRRFIIELNLNFEK